eukprot:g1688.t1
MPDNDWPDGDPTVCDKTAAGPKACKCDDVEACAVHITGCLSGCSGKTLTMLSSFFGCFSGKTEGTCDPTKSSTCASQTGVSASSLKSCVGNRKMLGGIYREIWKHGKKVQSFPDLVVGGKPVDEQKAPTHKFLSGVFCKAGLKAAC